MSGGEIGAIDGTLSIMVGGDAAALERVRPILEAMGNPERIIHIGESGAGQICKACNQLVIGGTLAAVGEAFALARKSHVDPGKGARRAAGRICRQPRARSAWRAPAERQLQTRLPRHVCTGRICASCSTRSTTRELPPQSPRSSNSCSRPLLARDGEGLDYSALGTVSMRHGPRGRVIRCGRVAQTDCLEEPCISSGMGAVNVDSLAVDGWVNPSRHACRACRPMAGSPSGGRRPHALLAVHGIANDRPALGREVHANLMCPAGNQAASQQRHRMSRLPL